MSWVNVALAADSLVQGSLAASNSREAGKVQAAALRYEADQEREAAVEQSAMIHRAGRYQVAETEAAYAAAGVQVGTGSAEEVQSQQFHDIEHDATMAILTGERKAHALEAGAVYAKTGAEAEGQAMQQQSIGQALAYGARGYTNWKTTQQLKTPPPVNPAGQPLGGGGRRGPA